MRQGTVYQVITAGVVTAVVGAGCGAERVAAPASYETYRAKDDSFQCDVPTGWETQGGGPSGMYAARFKMHDAVIDITTDTAGSLMSGSARIEPGMTLVEQMHPVVHLHEKGLTKMQEDFGNYNEQEAVDVRPRLGAGRKSQFTSSTTLGSTTRGVRATLLSKNHRIKIVCQCPEADWETLQPVFAKIIESFTYPGRR